MEKFIGKIMAICNKLASGQLEYDIDFPLRKLKITSDIPGSGNKGASFSDEWIDFDTINSILGFVGNILKRKSADFHQCFNNPSSNNGPMLAAILIDLKIIDNDYKVINLL